jgi:hypothetical protein
MNSCLIFGSEMTSIDSCFEYSGGTSSWGSVAGLEFLDERINRELP